MRTLIANLTLIMSSVLVSSLAFTADEAVDSQYSTHRESIYSDQSVHPELNGLTYKEAADYSKKFLGYTEIPLAGQYDHGPTDGHWGDWGSPHYCPTDAYVIGYSIKSERAQGKGDDTALNAIYLQCFGLNSFINEISSSQGPWGSRSAIKKCGGATDYVTGFRIQIEKPQGKGDDTSANDIELYCKNGKTISAGSNTSWGDWSKQYNCPDGKAIAGILTRVEGSVGKGDDTALNGVRFYCKDY